VSIFYTLTDISLDILPLQAKIISDKGTIMVGNMCELGTFIWRATDGGAAKENLFVCPAGMEYIDRQFETGNRLAIGSEWRSRQTRER
jgi:hypothetical protein